MEVVFIVAVIVLLFSILFCFFLLRFIEKTVNNDSSASKGKTLILLIFCLFMISLLFYFLILSPV